jgi:L-seryl-tRNA(Ser) seleniumtransferase
MIDEPTGQALLRQIPSVDEVLRMEAAQSLAEENGHAHTAHLARAALSMLRGDIAANGDEATKDDLLSKTLALMVSASCEDSSTRLRKVINCTGVVIHTNLGRAPLSTAAQRAIADEAAGYCTLEYDIGTGRRGKRAPRSESLIAELSGAEGALVVNNCAAAAFLVLSAFASGSEVVVSRGELVEIGGDFRIPDVLTQSGASLREVGTTNRTRLSDYSAGLENGAALILRVHPSNYRIVGFTAKPSLTELAELAKKRGVILYEDIGSGALEDLSEYGLVDEPLISTSIAAGVDIVTFSGDKLLGGPQAGIIAGRRDLIERLRRHPLYRALRVGKLIYAGLEATLLAYRRGTRDEVPVMAMLTVEPAAIRKRSEEFFSVLISNERSRLRPELLSGSSAVGGGAAPAVSLETTLITLRHTDMSAEGLEKALRCSHPTVITRIERDQVLIDLRTVSPEDEKVLLEILSSLAVS